MADSSAASSPSILELYKKAGFVLSFTKWDDFIRELARAAENVIGAGGISILFLDKQKKDLHFLVATGNKGWVLNGGSFPAGQGFAGWVITHGKSIIVQNVENDPRFSTHIDKTSGFQTRSVLAVPLMSGNSVVGVLEAVNKREGLFTPQDEKVLSILGALLMHFVNATSGYNFPIE